MMLLTSCLRDIKDVLSVTNRHFHVNEDKISKAVVEIQNRFVVKHLLIVRDYSLLAMFSDVWPKLNS